VQKLNSAVIISHAPPLDYRQDYVRLPRTFGTPAYDQRVDIQAIRALVG
jgi:hypothetical protein